LSNYKCFKFRHSKNRKNMWVISLNNPLLASLYDPYCILLRSGQRSVKSGSRPTSAKSVSPTFLNSGSEANSRSVRPFKKDNASYPLSRSSALERACRRCDIQTRGFRYSAGTSLLHRSSCSQLGISNASNCADRFIIGSHTLLEK
jgi:hypothetical protein